MWSRAGQTPVLGTDGWVYSLASDDGGWPDWPPGTHSRSNVTCGDSAGSMKAQEDFHCHNRPLGPGSEGRSLGSGLRRAAWTR